MSRPRSSFPAYRLHKPPGQAVVTLAGHDHYLGPYGSPASRTRYDRVILEWVSAGRPSLSTSSSDLSIAELCLAYWEHAQRWYQREGQPTGELFPLRSVIRLLRKTYGSVPIRQFGPRQLKALRQAMIQRGWSRKTINRQTSRVCQLFRWGVSEHMLPERIYRRLKTVDGLRAGRTHAREKDPVHPVAEETLNQTLKHLAPVVADMVRLQWLTGARPNEICSLRPAISTKRRMCGSTRRRAIRTSIEVSREPSSLVREGKNSFALIWIGPPINGVFRPPKRLTALRALRILVRLRTVRRP